MIVYLATYPRCGNSFLRGLITENWHYQVPDIYADGWPALRKKLVPLFLNEEPEPGFPGALWDKRIVTYTISDFRVRLLKPGCKDWLTPNIREQLAAEKNLFFLKTHERPFGHYFPGEAVIQMVRHPIAAIWSYKNLLDQRSRDPLGILDISEGETPFGSWSDYHADWSARRPERFLRVRFEDAHRNERRALRRIARFLDLPARRIQPTDFARFQQADPIRFRAGEVDGWRRHLPDKAVLAIAEHHRAVAKTLGYRLPRGDRSFVVRYVARQIHRVRSTKLAPPNRL